MASNLYHIRYTPLADQDLDEIDTYISNILSNPQAAVNLLDEMEQSMVRLRQFPQMGAEVEDSSLAQKGYRKLVVQNYLVFYLVDDEQKEIIIMRIIYGARNYHNLI